MTHPDPHPITAFISRWGPSGGAERSNYQIFLSELCDILGVERPQPASEIESDNAYIFEKNVPSPHGTTNALETRLLAHSRHPGPRLNLELLHEFAEAVGAYLDGPDPDVAALETLLDRWAADEAPEDDPRIILPCAAVLAYGQAGVSRPEWREDELAKLDRLAEDPRRPVREAVAAALDRLGAGR